MSKTTNAASAAALIATAALAKGASPGADATPAAGQVPKGIAARVLIDCEYGRVNTIAEFSTEIEAASAERAGLVDTHPDAVAYAQALQQAG